MGKIYVIRQADIQDIPRIEVCRAGSRGTARQAWKRDFPVRFQGDR